MASDGGSGCYLSGNDIRRDSDRSVVAHFDNHADAVTFYLDSAALRSRLDELALADKIEQELHRPPHVRKAVDPLGERKTYWCEDPFCRDGAVCMDCSLGRGKGRPGSVIGSL